MLRRTFLLAVFTVVSCLGFLLFSPWSYDAFVVAPEQASRLTAWISYDDGMRTADDCTPLNRTKVATMIETRDSPMLIPIIQSWLANMPNDWPFVIWTGEENHELLTSTPCFQDEIKSGRLNFTRIDTPGSIYKPDPRYTSTLSDLLANTNWFWTQFHRDAEWMMFFQIDSIMCSKSKQTVDDWLGYEFIGAPSAWSHGPGMDRLGGNGGLSLRRISALRDITTNTPRPAEAEPEDVWFTRRLRDIPTTRWPERENRPLYRFSMSQGWLEDASIDDAWAPLGLHHGSSHMGDALELDGAGQLTNKLHRILSVCPDYLLLRYALDEYRQVDLSQFEGHEAKTEEAYEDETNKSAGRAGLSVASLGVKQSPEMQAKVGDLTGDLHDLTPIFTEMVNVGKLNSTDAGTNAELTEKMPTFSTSSDDVRQAEKPKLSTSSDDVRQPETPKVSSSSDDGRQPETAELSRTSDDVRQQEPPKLSNSSDDVRQAGTSNR